MNFARIACFRSFTGALFLCLSLGWFSAYAQPSTIYANPEEEDIAPDIMEGLKYDCEFLSQYSEKLGITLDSTVEPRLLAVAADWLGTRYRHAGYSKAGIDCSGFVSMIYKLAYNTELTHSSIAMIYDMAYLIPKSEMKMGDIIFFKIHGPRSRISHVGIYLKDGVFIHASSHHGVVVNNLNAPYYKSRFYSAGRPKIMTPKEDMKSEPSPTDLELLENLTETVPAQ